jgi:hypothetical protein
MKRCKLIWCIIFLQITFCKAQTKSFAFKLVDREYDDDKEPKSSSLRYSVQYSELKNTVSLIINNKVTYSIIVVKPNTRKITVEQNAIWIHYTPSEDSVLYFAIHKNKVKEAMEFMTVTIKNAGEADFAILSFKPNKQLAVDINKIAITQNSFLLSNKLHLGKTPFRLLPCMDSSICNQVWLQKANAQLLNNRPDKPLELLINDVSQIDTNAGRLLENQKTNFKKIADSIMISYLGKDCNMDHYNPPYFASYQDPDCEYALVGYQYYSAKNEINFRIVLGVSIKDNTYSVMINEGSIPNQRLTINEMAFLNTKQMKTKARVAFPTLDLVLSVNAMDTTKKDVGFIPGLPVVKTDWQGKEFEPSLQGLEVSEAGKLWKGGFVFKAYSKVQKNNDYVEIYFFDAISGVFLYKEICKTKVFG